MSLPRVVFYAESQVSVTLSGVVNYYLVFVNFVQLALGLLLHNTVFTFGCDLNFYNNMVKMYGRNYKSVIY